MTVICLFLLCSGVALKLSDPISLRDESEENISLQAWCAGTGCVMPFTPKACQSWCDWNYDKQADAEARGAFGGSVWGKKQKKATDFFMQFCVPVTDESACHADAGKTYTSFFQSTSTGVVAGSGWATKHAPIYPGGDAEQVLGDTQLACDECYTVQAATSGNTAPVVAQWSVQFIASGKDVGHGALLKLFTYDATKKCSGTATLQFKVSLPKFTAGAARTGADRQKGPAWIAGTGAALTMRKFVDVAGAAYCATTFVADSWEAAGANKKDTGLKCDDTKTKTDGGGMATGGAAPSSENQAAWQKRAKCCTDIHAFQQMGFGLSAGLAWPTCD